MFFSVIVVKCKATKLCDLKVFYHPGRTAVVKQVLDNPRYFSEPEDNYISWEIRRYLPAILRLLSKDTLFLPPID